LNIFFAKNWMQLLSGRWRSLGAFNRGVIVAAGMVSFSLSVSLYFYVKQQYELRDIKCLAMNVYHEARGEPTLGQYAVAIVTMNRVSSRYYPDDVCRVVYQSAWSSTNRRQIAAFSWTLDALEDIPQNSDAWGKAFNIATAVYQEEHAGSDKIKDALFYHADYVKPRWASKKTKIAKIGRHIFYK